MYVLCNVFQLYLWKLSMFDVFNFVLVYQQWKRSHLISRIFFEGTGSESIWLWEALGLGIFGGVFFAHKVWHAWFLRETDFGVALMTVRFFHRQRVDLEDTSQGQGAWPAEGTGHLGVETGRDALWEQTSPVSLMIPVSLVFPAACHNPSQSTFNWNIRETVPMCNVRRALQTTWHGPLDCSLETPVPSA